MREKYKKTHNYLNYVEQFFILSSTATACVSVSAFASLAFVPVGMTSSPRAIKI